MAGSATLTLQQGVLGHTLGFAALPETVNIYVALCMAATPPTATTAGAEVSGGGYVRQAAVFALLSGSSNVAANTLTLEYPPAAADWGAVGYFELWSAITGGTRLYWGPLVSPVDGVTPITRNVLTGDIVRFSAGVIQVQAV